MTESMFSTLINLILPKELLDYFKVTDIQEHDNEVNFFLEELHIVPEGYKKENLLSKGFYPEIIIQDFPLRERLVHLHIKRRKWEEKLTKKIVSRDWNIVAKGTRLTQEFAAFLKEILG